MKQSIGISAICGVIFLICNEMWGYPHMRVEVGRELFLYGYIIPLGTMILVYNITRWIHERRK